MDEFRTALLRDASAFLAASGMRPRAVVVQGRPGIGKSTFIDRLQVELLSAGRTSMMVIDDADGIDANTISVIRDRIDADSRIALVIGASELADELAAFLDAAFDRRIVELPRLSERAARDLLVELGIQPWTMHATQLLSDADGNPRELIDRSFGSLDVSRIPSADATFDGENWSWGIARRMQLAYSEQVDELRAFMDECNASAAPDDRLVLVEVALNDGDLEGAIQQGEQLVVDSSLDERTRILGSALVSAARALRGEPTALLSLHALAGRASRSGMPIVEAYVWYRIAACTGVLGDVATSRRAAERCITMADEAGAVVLALLGRFVIAELHLAAGEGMPAGAYLREISSYCDAHGYHRLHINGRMSEARAALLAGDVEGACTLADAALELVVRFGGSRMDMVDAAVVAARAYAAGGSNDLALVPIESFAAELGDSHSPDFWLVLEAVRVLGKAGSDPAAFKKWLARMEAFDADGHGGALRAAHAEVDAWRAAVEGRKAEAARLAERAKQLWIDAECHDELPLLEPILQQAPMEHGPRISLVGSPTGPMPDPEAFDVLTKREREIARYVAGGLTNPEIAGELHLSPRTVEHHVASILRKLELPSRRALVRGQL